jgi:hypothetical protein
MTVHDRIIPFHKFIKKRRTLFLLLFLLVLIVVSSLLEDTLLDNVILVILLSFILLWGMYAISHNARLIAISLTLVVPTTILIWMETFFSTTPLLIARFVLSALTIFFILFVMLFNILKVKEVTSYEIYAALSVYILIALAYSQIYSLFYFLNPLSINIEFGHYSFSSILYFSFVCLSTEGFGDIVAVTPLARSIVVLELISGVFFVAILIARLIGGLSFYKTEGKKNE